MSKGSVRVTIRIGSQIRQAIEDALKRRSSRPGGIEEWTISRWCVVAIIEKLNHGERSRRSKRRYQFHQHEDGSASIQVYGDPNGTKDPQVPHIDQGWTEDDVKQAGAKLGQVISQKDIDEACES